MKITKFVHSCLLIEEGEVKLLIDPGEYSFEEGGLEVSKLPKIDYLLITHEHGDHMSIDGIKQILVANPELKIITNPSALNILASERIETQVGVPDFIRMKEVPHEPI